MRDENQQLLTAQASQRAADADRARNADAAAAREQQQAAAREDLLQARLFNPCMEAVNMLRESHRALMANDARMREELHDLRRRYRRDARQWKDNFRDLQQYYQGLQEAPPLVAQEAMEERADYGYLDANKGVAVASAAAAAARRWQEDGGGGGGDVDDGSRRAVAAAWGPRVSRAAAAAFDPEDGTAVMSTRKEALGSLSPVSRRRRGDDLGGGGGLSPSKRREREQDALDDQMLEQIQWTYAMSSARKAIETHDEASDVYGRASSPSVAAAEASRGRSQVVTAPRG